MNKFEEQSMIIDYTNFADNVSVEDEDELEDEEDDTNLYDLDKLEITNHMASVFTLEQLIGLDKFLQKNYPKIYQPTCEAYRILKVA